MQVYYDCRWVGEHGIGRFATEVGKHLCQRNEVLGGRPMSPIDPLRLSLTSALRNRWLLSPGYNAPLWGRTPYVFTLHDLNHIERRENGSILKTLYYGLILKRLAKRARAVLTVSEYSRSRIIRWSGVDASRVFNVGNGVSSVFRPDGRRSDNLGEYLLCVSNRKDHKNEAGLLSAFSQAKLPLGTKLVFTGEPADKYVQLVIDLGLVGRVEYVGRVSEEELAALYRGALFLVFPSYYEGFGLPIVEAFASGTPVITSNVTSMPEIAGDAALLIDPTNASEIASSIEKLYASPQLRDELAQRGLLRAKEFTWGRVAQRIKNAVGQIDTDSSNPLSWG